MSDQNIEDRNAELASVRQATLDMPHDELFRNAMAEPEAPAAEPPQQPPQAEPPQVDPGRHEYRDPSTGQFAQRPAEQPQPGDPAQPAPDDIGDVPSWRHREMRQERDAAANRAAQLEYMLMQQQQQLNAMRQRFEPPPQQPQIPDVISDPEAYTRHLQNTFAEALRNQEANTSFRLAHRDHGPMFEQAYAEMIGRAEQGDPSIVRAVMANPDPGTAMVNWYMKDQSQRIVGPDPYAWFNQTLGERLQDPQFQGQVIEYMNSLRAPAAAPAAQGGMRTAVNLPPSLNRMSGSAPSSAGTGDMSDASLFHHAFREGRR
jgi:hypothetical protein